MPTDFQKAKRRVKLANGNWSKPISYLTSSESVEMTDGSNLQTTINNKVDKVTGKDLSTNDYTDADKIAVSSLGTASTKDVGTANGVAELDSNGKVPSSQLPSYVDDVIEGYYNSSTDRFYKESTFTTVIPPEDGKSWVDIASNKSYRWTGSVYVRVDEGVQLGETSSTAYRGDRGKTAYDHSQTTGNPHGTTKNDIGLGNVNNTADLDKPISTATQTELDKKETIQSSSINMQKNYQYTGHYGVKNLIELTVEKIKELNGGESTWNGNSKTISGLTYTIITDENNNVSGIMASGTYTGTNDYCRLVVFKDFEAHSNLYTINNYDGNIELEIISTNGTIYYSEGVVQQGRSIDIGNSDLYFNGELRIPKNITVSDSIAKPMIRPYVVTSPTFEPYAKSNQQLTHDLSTSLTATGNPLTIESSESNLVECTAEVEAVQEGSGDPSPENIRPIIGQTEIVIEDVGKNLLNNTATTTTTGGVTYTVNQDKTISCSNTATGVSNITIISNATLKAGSYILTGCPSGGGMETMRLHAYRTNGGYLGFDIGIGAEFTLENDINDLNVEIRIGSGVNANGKIFKPMIRLSTETDTTYEAYKGKTYRVEIGQKNKLPPFTSTTVQGVTITVNAQGVVTLNGTSTGNGNINIGVSLKAGTYKISGAYGNSDFYKSGTMGNNNRMYIYDGSSSYFDNVSGGREFTLSQDTTCTVYLVFVSGYTFNNSVIYPMIRTTTDDSEFVPYNPNLPEAIYGGELDVLSGELRVTHGEVDLGTLDYAKVTQYGYTYFSGSTITNKKFNSICSDYVAVKRARDLLNNGEIGTYNTSNSFAPCIRDDTKADLTVEQFKTAMNGVQLVYELATPYTIQLTPQQIRLLKGTNHLSCNTGDLTIKYYPDNVLGQLKGDIEDEYDERIVNLEEKVDARTAKVYSFHINDAESNPSDKVTYLDDAVGMTPAHMNFSTGKFDYGSWGNVWFVKECKPCILGQDGKVYKYLNPNNYGTDIDILDSDPYNVMIEFPKIWYKVTPDENDPYSGTVSISSVKIDEGYKDYAYIDYKGNHKEHFYMPAYNGSLVNNVIRSLSYKQVSKTLNAQTEINYCKANGSGWYTEDAGEIMLINFLLILMGKSTDMQSVYGQGLHTGGTEAINNSFTTGVHNNKGLFYGTNSGTIASGSYGNAVKVFGIENYWGFQWRRYAGDILVDGVRKIKLCYGNEDGSSTFDYNLTGNGYVNVGATPSGTSGGYISEMKFTNTGMYSKVSSGSSSTHYCDGQWYNSGTRYAFRGGDSTDGALVGAFCVYLGNAASDAWWTHGAAPSYR